MLNNKKKKKGFTLIELIIVIAIIAVLAAIAMPKFGQIRQNANIKADIAAAKNIHSALTAKVQEESLTADDVKKLTLKDFMDAVPVPKVDSAKNTNFHFSLDDKGNVIVTVGGSTAGKDDIQIYPQPEDVSKNIWYGGKVD